MQLSGIEQAIFNLTHHMKCTSACIIKKSVRHKSTARDDGGFPAAKTLNVRDVKSTMIMSQSGCFSVASIHDVLHVCVLIGACRECFSLCVAQRIIFDFMLMELLLFFDVIDIKSSGWPILYFQGLISILMSRAWSADIIPYEWALNIYSKRYLNLF